MGTRLVETKQSIFFSKNGRVRLERGTKWLGARGRFRRSHAWTFFLTIKFGFGAGYQDNGKRGATFTAGTRVKAYRARGQVSYPWFKMRYTRNGNHRHSFYPSWF